MPTKNPVPLNVKIVLITPITVDGATLSELSIRRPKVRDMLAMENMAKNEAEKEINLFANLCELTPEALHELDMSDYAKLQKAYQDFLS